MKYRPANESDKKDGIRMIIKDIKTGAKLKITEFWDEENNKPIRVFGWFKREGESDDDIR